MHTACMTIPITEQNPVLVVSLNTTTTKFAFAEVSMNNQQKKGYYEQKAETDT